MNSKQAQVMHNRPPVTLTAKSARCQSTVMLPPTIPKASMGTGNGRARASLWITPTQFLVRDEGRGRQPADCRGRCRERGPPNPGQLKGFGPINRRAPPPPLVVGLRARRAPDHRSEAPRASAESHGLTPGGSMTFSRAGPVPVARALSPPKSALRPRCQGTIRTFPHNPQLFPHYSQLPRSVTEGPGPTRIIHSVFYCGSGPWQFAIPIN